MWNTFSCNINLFLSTPDYFSCNIKNVLSIQNCFLRNTKCLFWAFFRMLRHGYIFLLSCSNKNIITCQKFFCSIFTLHICSILIFFVVVLETKKLLVHLFMFAHLPDIWKQLLRAALKKNYLYLGLIFVKDLWMAHVLVRLQASFPQLFKKWTP